MLLSFPALFGQQTVDYILKARALREAGKPEQAISLLDGAISGSNDARLLLERAEANILKGDYSGAISDFNEANRILPAAGEYRTFKNLCPERRCSQQHSIILRLI